MGKDLEVKLPGKPSSEDDQLSEMGSKNFSATDVFQPRNVEHFVCAADDLCLGITEKQTEKDATIEVHFEKWAFEEIKNKYPLESVLAADISEQEVMIFIQGDKLNPILYGKLAGRCIPEQTRWKMTSSEKCRVRQVNPGGCSPALEVKLVKETGEVWASVFSNCIQHRLMIQELTEDGPKRFEGLNDADILRRGGYDLNEPDFWSYVDQYVNETMKKTGNSTAPRKLVV